MKFKEIKSLLGHEAIVKIQGNITAVLQASGGNHETVCALREFLVGMLAAIVTTKTYLLQSERLAAEDAVKLNALVSKIKEIALDQSAPPMPAHCVTRWAADADQSRKVVPFPGTALAQPTPEAGSAAGRELMPHLASLSAARSAVARRKELTAQKREVLARSQALLAQSRSLRTSLEAVQFGRCP